MKIKTLSHTFKINNMEIEIYNKIKKQIMYILIYNTYIRKHIT